MPVQDQTKALMEMALKTASKHFNGVDPVLPVFLVEGKDGTVLPIGTPFNTDHEKMMVAMFVRAKCAELEAQRYVFVCEAWTLLKPPEIPDSVKLGGSIASHPDRVEVITVTGHDYEGFALAYRRILRPERGKAKLAPVEWPAPTGSGEFDKSAGRFSNLLPPKNDPHADAHQSR
jgi:hypothetical protein